MSGYRALTTGERFFDASPMTSRLRRTDRFIISSWTISSKDRSAKLVRRNFISSRMWARYTESRFTPDHLALHVLPDEGIEPSDGEQVDFPPVEIFQEVGERHEVPKRETIR